MAQIPLSHGFFAVVDDDDIEALSKWKWSRLRNGNLWYVSRKELLNEPLGYGKGRTPRRLILMHRQILNAAKGEIVDHINRNPLDNRKENLRIVTSSQNAMNRGARNTSKSGLKGVTYRGHLHHKQWEARIGKGAQVKSLGLYGTPEEAHAVYIAAAIEKYGEYAARF